MKIIVIIEICSLSKTDQLYRRTIYEENFQRADNGSNQNVYFSEIKRYTLFKIVLNCQDPLCKQSAYKMRILWGECMNGHDCRRTLSAYTVRT